MSKELILVVDDNHTIADFTAGTLLPSMGYKAIIAYNARSAREIIARQPVSLMILDLQLPDMTGLDLLRKLNADGYQIPTILVTAHGSEQVAIDAFRLGAENYLIKPVDAQELEVAVNRALTESRLAREKDSLNKQLKEQVSMLTILAKVGQSVTSTLEPDEVLMRIVDACVHFTKADEGFLALLDQSGDIYLRAVKNIDEKRAKTLRLPVTDSLIGSVMITGKPLRISEEDQNALVKVSTGYLVHNLLYVPIMGRGKAIGVLSVDNHTTNRPFKKVDEVMLTYLADYAGVAIENANLYQRAQEEIRVRRKVESALRESEERYSLAVRGANDGLYDWDLKKNHCHYSPRWKEILGYSDGEVRASPDEWFSRIHPEDLEKVKLELASHFRGDTAHFENEHRICHKDGTYRWILTRGIAVWDSKGAPVRMVGSFSDINNRKVAEQKLLYDAFHDGLTDLPNRTLFLDRLSLAVERAKRRDDYLFAVLFLDIDRFKDINDSLGHSAGDQLLKNVASILARGSRATDTVARMGGDEFAILLEDIEDISYATRVAERIQQDISSPGSVLGRDVFISASLGIVLSATGYGRAEDVLRDAEIAMYRAKQRGKARYEIFDEAMRVRIMERMEVEGGLRLAFERGELCIHYQPIFSLKTNSVCGFEALLRWQHPQHGLIYPGKFIPIAEETGMITQMGMWVLAHASRQMKELLSRYPVQPPLTLSVNLSGKQIVQPDLVEQIEAVLEQTGLDPRCLKIEITESLLMENIEAIVNTFQRLREMNIQVQVDDFGTGYSSLSYLANFPVDTLKVDQSFVRALDKDSGKSKIIQAIVMLASGLGLDVIAEGVETNDELQLIKSIGCEKAQGFYLCRPLDEEQLEGFLQSHFVEN